MKMRDSLHRLIALRGSLRMGIVNATPDSFSDGGRYLDPARALRRRDELLADGIEIIDVGAESTRPGARELTPEEEWARLEPVLTAFREAGRREEYDLSVDTRHAAVAEKAAALGMEIVNDVGLSPELAAVAAKHGCYLVLMAPRLTPEGDAVEQVRAWWRRGMEQAASAGVARDRLIFDPGLGFDQTFEQSWELVRRIGELAGFGPRLVGHSRKRFIGAKFGIERPEDRDEATARVACELARNGVEIIRMHRPEWLKKSDDGSVFELKNNLTEQVTDK